MRLRRWIAIGWGCLLVLLGTTILAWTAYKFLISSEPPDRPWWQGILMLFIWIPVIYVGLRRIFPRAAQTAGTDRWDSQSP